MFSTTCTTFRRSPTQPRKAHLPQALAAVLLTGGLAGLPATAATIAVTSPDDSDTGTITTCTLRQAIMSMDVGGLVGSCSKSGAFGVDDTIVFAASAITGAATPGTVTLADSADQIGNVGGTLLIFDPHLTIDGSAWRGNGAGQYSDGVTIARPTGATHAFGIIRDTAASGGSLTLKGLTIRNGSAIAGLCNGFGEGGGICIVAADLSMTDSKVSGNFAGNGGGGIAAPTGEVTLTRCAIENNIAYLGGGLHFGSGNATVMESTISGNGDWTVSHGGGIRAEGTLVMVGSTISGNIGKIGAGIDAVGDMSLTRSVVIDNQAYYRGGGIHVPVGGTATVTGSSIIGNSARYGGGGVYAEGTLTASNSTISGNFVLGAGGGVLANGAIEFRHVTLSGNASSGLTGGIDGSGHGTIDHSIVAGNSQSSGTDIHLGGGWTGSYNLTSTANLDLGPLQDNGGPTWTMLPGVGSTAIDAIPLQACTESVDQRGVARPQYAGCDTGAVEVAPDIIFVDGFDAPHA
ncbi:MAG: choice-of-anchor Q domain-containing protein [Dokdonella sp.]